MSIDPAAIEMLQVADERGIETMFHRAETGSICPTGAEGGCCKVCYMGPCRFIGKDKNEKRGVCGATLGTVVARNYLRECAGGASAHADHGRDIAHTLLLIGRGEAKDYKHQGPRQAAQGRRLLQHRHGGQGRSATGARGGDGGPQRLWPAGGLPDLRPTALPRSARSCGTSWV